MTAILVLLLHVSIWGLGWSIFRLAQARDTARCAVPACIAAYFVGLVLHCLTAFVIDQFLGIPLTTASLLAVSIVWLLPLTILRQPRASNVRPCGGSQPAEPWTRLQVLLCGAIIVILAETHALRGPLVDWDTLMYHIPFGQLIAAGHFPSELGRSQVLEVEAAYPPLFYFQYGLNVFLAPGYVYLLPRLMILVVNSLVCVVTYFVARQRLLCGRSWSLAACLATALTINTAPNIQAVTTLYLLLAIFYSFEMLEARRNGWASCWVAAILWSGVYWNNYIGLPLIGLFLGGLIVAQAVQFIGNRRAVLDYRIGLRLGLLILTLIAPHLVRNTLVTGNPIYPGLWETIGGHDITEWFLSHAPAGSRRIEKDWRFLSVSLFVAKPLAHFVLAGSAAAISLRTIAVRYRVLLFCVVAGFFCAWFELLHLNIQSLHRYLHPVVPLGLALTAAHFNELSAAGWRSALCGSGYVWVLGFLLATTHTFSPVLLICCLVLAIGAVPAAAALLMRSGPPRTVAATSPEPGPIAYLAVIYLLFVVGGVLNGVATLVVPFIVAMLILICLVLVQEWFGRGSRQVGLLLCLGVGLFASRSDWPQANTFALEITDDLNWLNANVERGSAVLLFDGRVATLQRDFVPVDSLRAEQFHLASSPGAAIAELNRLGVTHFYFSFPSANLLPASFSDKFFLFPAPGNPHVRLVYQSSTGWIAEIRPRADELPAAIGSASSQ